MTWLAKLREVIGGRSKGPWAAQRSGTCGDWATYRIQGIGATDRGGISEGNARFIALLGSCADEILSVVEAAETHVRKGGMRNAQALSDALASLRRRVEEET